MNMAKQEELADLRAEAEALGVRLPDGNDPGDYSITIGLTAPTLTNEQVCNIGFAVLRAHNDDRLWRALTYDSGPYDLTTPNLALQELGAAFYAAGAASVPHEPLRRLWPLIERGMKDYVFTGDKAGEVAADMAALRKCLGA